MQYHKFIFGIFLVVYSTLCNSQQKNYNTYHQTITTIEALISEEQFSEALLQYEKLFENYDFIFVRDYKIATQLAVLLSEHDKAFDLLRKGISAGWNLKDIKKNHLIKRLKSNIHWKTLKRDYKTLRKDYLQQFDSELQNTVKKMFSKDQWKALMAALKLSEKAQERYLEKKFIPHSEVQIKALLKIIKTRGYPGERLVGNNYWTSTIISHHNSITTNHTKQDTLYPTIKPLLIHALEEGNISPFELASMDEWYLMTKNDSEQTFYGILERPKENNIEAINKRRRNYGLRSIATRDKLIALEDKLGITFYLDGDPWY